MTDEEIIEEMARSIFCHRSFGAPVKWMDGGNSLKQDEARDYARAAFAIARARIREQCAEELCTMANRSCTDRSRMALVEMFAAALRQPKDNPGLQLAPSSEWLEGQSQIVEEFEIAHVLRQQKANPND